jgi:endonuclease YncB( thermonuclease family)
MVNIKVLILCLVLAATVGAQELYQAEQPNAWSDGALSGDELMLFVQTTSGKFEKWRARLAGVSAPRSTGGGDSEVLDKSATLALANLTSGQELFVRIVGSEDFREAAAYGRPQPPTTQRRLIVTVLLANSLKNRQTHERDAAWLLLRSGFAFLNCRYKEELSQLEAKPYEAAQVEAKEKRRGMWGRIVEWQPDDCLERPVRRRVPQSLPVRKVRK